jgi:hypothetical protein
MKRVLLLVAIVIVATGGAVAAGCSSSSAGSGTGADGGAGDDGGSCAKIDSSCGQPCDPGNALGVGHYCDHIPDCTSLPQAHLCSSLGDLTTHFCTFRCSLPDAAPPDGGDGGLPFPTDCGQGAVCTCDNSGANCGCTPSVCLGSP